MYGPVLTQESLSKQVQNRAGIHDLTFTFLLGVSCSTWAAKQLAEALRSSVTSWDCATLGHQFHFLLNFNNLAHTLTFSCSHILFILFNAYQKKKPYCVIELHFFSSQGTKSGVKVCWWEHLPSETLPSHPEGQSGEVRCETISSVDSVLSCSACQ